MPRWIETSTRSRPEPPSDAVPQTPLGEQPAFQLAMLYEAVFTGKLVVELGAAVSIVQVKLAGVASVLPAASVARTWKVWEPSARPV